MTKAIGDGATCRLATFIAHAFAFVLSDLEQPSLDDLASALGLEPAWTAPRQLALVALDWAGSPAAVTVDDVAAALCDQYDRGSGVRAVTLR